MTLLTVSLLVRWLLGWALCLRLAGLPGHRLNGQPAISVLIPARNEEATLPNLLPALARQSLTPLEVIVIDDHSSDATAAIAARRRRAGAAAAAPARGLVRQDLGPAPRHPRQPGGAAGVPRCRHRTRPAVPRAARGQPAELGGLVSVQPFHRTEKPYEQLSLLFNLVGLMAVPMGPQLRRGLRARHGHQPGSLRTQRRARGRGRQGGGGLVPGPPLRTGRPAVSAFIGKGLIEYRMYPGGLRDMVVGFSKNFATAAGEVRWLWMVAVVLWLSGCSGPPGACRPPCWAGPCWGIPPPPAACCSTSPSPPSCCCSPAGWAASAGSAWCFRFPCCSSSGCSCWRS